MKLEYFTGIILGFIVFLCVLDTQAADNKMVDIVVKLPPLLRGQSPGLVV